ncbi:DUF4180 domain-containing protein [Cytophaga hutchinsonii]|uniref:DUF4180 domain-containing protein n=1 Tax=Cytophaga hutchinsonii (strain ATCC 33406 / DSM 1761 / CIP 103989 / NBRC 15051 / NCIMB 9469 / D465) TaxID=269798 RepID=A0A6N4SWA7_CYTH3|nr:DUF4180 domain-containing protein [Cytophaga hutchinsonii]ABG60830.1 conserved hypothetical protein [Cytophaga hutchinsonii ATCC 33406]SFX72776.1 protein of unknown function [Cytophaga hutchinsonii ATCC 33406]
MNIHIHPSSTTEIAEVLSGSIVISTIEDALNLMADIYYQGYDAIILHEKNITPAFFDLKTGIAGEILQKFSNYRMRLAIVGDFVKYNSKSFNDFVFESNKNKQINFVESLEEAIERLG